MYNKNTSSPPRVSTLPFFLIDSWWGAVHVGPCCADILNAFLTHDSQSPQMALQREGNRFLFTSIWQGLEELKNVLSPTDINRLLLGSHLQIAMKLNHCSENIIVPPHTYCLRFFTDLWVFKPWKEENPLTLVVESYFEMCYQQSD